MHASEETSKFTLRGTTDAALLTFPAAECLEGVTHCHESLRVARFEDSSKGRGLVAITSISAGTALIHEIPEVVAGETDNEAMMSMARAITTGDNARFSHLCMLPESSHSGRAEDSMPTTDTEPATMDKVQPSANKHGRSVSQAVFAHIQSCVAGQILECETFGMTIRESHKLSNILVKHHLYNWIFKVLQS
eukprot:scaffold365925_cov31-Prasinocladus_malaysianus.AAC.1